MKTKALDRAGRKITIVHVLAIRIQHDNYDYASSYWIAKQLRLSPSQKLRVMLNEMTADGLLECCQLDKRGRWQGWGYRLAKGTYERPSRSIKVKSKGVPKGQLELL
jgi:hypothetical protein